MVLVGFALRVHLLAAQSLWYDEGVSWYLTQMSLPQLTTWTANDIQPPLYYYLLWFWVRIAGTSEYALRFPSVLFAALTLPMLWRVGRRLFGSPGAWIVLLLGLLSPLHVYYAQEARMYTLLILLGLTSTYLWLHLLGIGHQSDSSPSQACNWPIVVGYAITMAAALYTHYFAVFLFAAHVVSAAGVIIGGCFATSSTLSKGTIGNVETAQLLWIHSRLGSLAVAATLVPFFYAPWLPFVLGRYGQDASYWPGTLSFWEMARRLFLTFSFGETVKEFTATQLGLGFGVIFASSVLALTLWGGRRPIMYPVTVDHHRRNDNSITRGDVSSERRPTNAASRFCCRVVPFFLLICLIVPAALVLFLAWRVPKFNPRYAILAWPAFVLILAGGLAVLINWRRTVGLGVLMRLLPHFTGFLALGFVLSTSVYSLRNWYLPYKDNQFNKADFRITAQVVRERILPSEAVLLSSGHMAPAWAYYYGWEGWHPLPPIETLDVRAVLDLSVEDQLEDILTHKSGVWLVRWQNETTDPFNVLPLLLGAVGIQDDYGQFWHMELLHYRLPSRMRFDLEYFITHPVRALLGEQIRLLGLRFIPEWCGIARDVAKAHPQQHRHMELVLVWQAVARVKEDYAVFVHLKDSGGRTLANGDHLPARPTQEWPVGSMFPDHVSLRLPSEMPSGSYWLEVGLYHPDLPEMPRLGPVVLEPSGELQPAEQVLIPIHLKGECTE